MENSFFIFTEKGNSVVIERFMSITINMLKYLKNWINRIFKRLRI